MKERRRLLEEEIKREGGVNAKPLLDATGKPIVDASGKPCKTSIPLVDASGKVLGEKDLSEYHISEDIDAVLKQRGSEGVKVKSEGAVNGREGAMNGKESALNGKEKVSNNNEKKTNKQNKTTTTHTMKSASEAMLNVYAAKEGDTIEICPEACMLMQEVVQWLETTTGEGEKRR